MKLVVACAFVSAFCWAEPANAPKAASRQDMIEALMRRAPADGSAQVKALDVDELRRNVRRSSAFSAGAAPEARDT